MAWNNCNIIFLADTYLETIMSDTAIFELRTNIDKDILLKQVVQIWSNQAYTGYEVDIFNFSPDKIY